MVKKEERVLVQGTVTFTINCNILKGLVTPDLAKDETRLKDWLEDKAFKMIDSADVDVDVDYERCVSINADTANKLTNETIDNSDWKKCIEEDKNNA